MVDALRTTWRNPPSLSDAPSGRCRAPVAWRYGVQGATHGVRSEVRLQNIGPGAVAARQVGNVFYDRGFADVFLRHLMQTEGRMHMTMNRLQCDIQLQGCQPGHKLPEHPKTMGPVAEDIVRSPDVSAWKSALYDGLESADGFHVLSVDGSMKIATGVRRRDAGTALTPRGSQQDHVDHKYVRADNAYVARCCLGPCRGPQRQQTHCCRVSPGERGAPRRSGVHWAVVDNASPALHAALSWSFPSLRGVALDTCHLPIKCEAVDSHHGSAGSRMLRRLGSKFDVSFPSEVCPGRGRAQTLSRRTEPTVHQCQGVLVRPSVSRVAAREHTDAAVTSMKRAEVWSGLAEWIRAWAALATLHPEDLKNKHSRKGKSRLRFLMAAATFQRCQWYLAQCTTPLDGGVPAGGHSG